MSDNSDITDKVNEDVVLDTTEVKEVSTKPNIQKPKRVLTEKQKEALKLGQQRRKDSLIEKNQKKSEEDEKKEQLKTLKEKKKLKEDSRIEQLLKQFENDDSDSEEEIIIVKKKPKGNKTNVSDVVEVPVPTVVAKEKTFQSKKHKNSSILEKDTGYVKPAKEIDYSQFFV